MPRPSRSWIEGLRAAGVLAVLVALFLSTPLRRYDEVHFTSADLLNDLSLTRVEDGHVPRNKLTSDTVTQMLPWVLFNREELAAGRIPLWNPRNATGCPHLANYQSAVFSPFSLPYYLLDLKPALLLSAFARLLALGLFTYLFLRELRTAWIAALLGSVVFMLSAYSILLLGHPHGGVMVALPAGLLFAEKALRRLEEGNARIGAPLAGLALALALGLLAGHPEPMPWIVLAIAAWIAVRLVGLALAARERGEPIGPLARAGGAFVAAGLAGAGLAAFQLLPFLEYVDHSTVLARHDDAGAFLDPHFWPLAFYPALLGVPNPPFHIALNVPYPNIVGVCTPYVGGTVVFLAILGIPFVRGDRRLRFFLAGAAIWAVLAYDVLGSSRLLSALPGASFAPMNRSEGTWAFLVACAAALALDGLLRRDPPRAWRSALATAAAGIAFWAVFRIGASRLAEEYASRPAPDRAAFDAFVERHVASTGALFAAGVAAVFLLGVARTRAWRLVAGSVLVAVAFLGDGWMFRDYHAVSEDRFVYPVTPAIRELRERIGTDRVAVLGEDTIPPHANLPLGIAVINHNDALGVRDFDAFFTSRFGASYAWHPIVKARTTGLRLCGARWVLAKWDWLSVDSRNVWDGEIRNRPLAPVTIGPGRTISQDFVCDRDRLQAVMVYLGVGRGAAPGDLRVRIVEAGTGTVACDRVIQGEELGGALGTAWDPAFRLDPRLTSPGRPFVVRFDPRPDSRGRTYSIELSGDSGGAPIAWVLETRKGAEIPARSGDEALPGPLLAAWVADQGPFELVDRIGEFALYRDAGSPGKYWTVDRAIAARDGADALELLRAETFDPTAVAVIGPGGRDDPAWRRASRRILRPEGSMELYLVLEDGRSVLPVGDEARQLRDHLASWSVEAIAPRDFAAFEVTTPEAELERRLGGPPVAGAPPRVLEESSTSIRLEVDRPEPGYLVVSQTYFPGWGARVDGVETPVLRANYAFTAVELPGGRSLVELEYDPASFRWGAWIALASAALGLLGIALSRRRDAAP